MNLQNQRDKKAYFIENRICRFLLKPFLNLSLLPGKIYVDRIAFCDKVLTRFHRNIYQKKLWSLGKRQLKRIILY